MSKHFKAVVIGSAHVHILEVCQYCHECEHIDLAAVSDPEPVVVSDRAVRPDAPYTRSWNLNFVRKYGMKIYDDYIEMLEKEKPDLAFITTENALHAAVYEQCAIRGIAAIVEKPLACTLADAQKMARLSRLNKTELMVNWPIAWRPWLYQMKAALDSGEVGHLVKTRYLAGMTGCVGPGMFHRGTGEIRAVPMTEEEKAAMWWNHRCAGGGAMLDMCCYGGMVSSWLAGEPAQGVMAMAGNFNTPYGDIEDNACILVRFPQSAAVVEGTWTTPGAAIAPGPEIYCSGGVIRCERRGALAAVKVMDLYGNEKELDIRPQEAHLRNLPCAYAHHRLTGAPMPDFTLLETNLQTIAMLDAASRSAVSGRYETVDNAVWFK